MLEKFSVKGFKNFETILTLDFSDVHNYEFNECAVENNIVKDAVVYGPNSSGKSNLGYAIFDIIILLTDKMRNISKYMPYVNLYAETNMVEFNYLFKFSNNKLEYRCVKTAPEILLAESIKINGNEVISWTAEDGVVELSLPGAENLNLSLYDGKISFAKYVYRNTSLDKNNETVKVFYSFFDFIDRMLLFKSLHQNEYIGFTNGSGSIAERIISNGKLDEFQSFLKKYGIDYQLKASADKQNILCVFPKGEYDFFKIASTGTASLALYFFWVSNIEQVSLLFIDEYDAFYHFDISKMIVNTLKKYPHIQCILTTHNTDLLSNDILRPDCYFILNQGEIKSLPNCTNKELRLVHTLQKLYKAGAFNHDSDNL